jgi:hypothetical protein
MKKVLNKFLLLFFVMPALFSCVNNNYDLDNIDESGGLSPAITLPIGTINTSIIDFIEGAGINNFEVKSDTIYIVYEDNMSLDPQLTINYGGLDVITLPSPSYGLPLGFNIPFGFSGGNGSIDIDVFKDLAASGSVLRPSDPRIYCTIHNYLGANININIDGITSYNENGEREDAIFSGGSTSSVISVGSAPAPNSETVHKVIFNKINGEMNRLFSNSPERLFFDFNVNLAVPENGFIVKDKYIDLDYKVEIPMTFANGTQLAYADTLEFDLSGEDFINDLDELKLWIDYENRLQASISLNILFLDKYKNVIPGIAKENLTMNAAPPYSGTDMQNAPPTKGSLNPVSFDQNKINDAKKTYYVVLKSILKIDGNNDVNIHPSDYINLKLSAYTKINI